MPNSSREQRKKKWGAILLCAIGLGIAGVVLSRQPALTWWQGPAVDSQGHRVQVLVPTGWSNRRAPLVVLDPQHKTTHFLAVLVPSDRRPAILRWLIPAKLENAQLVIHCDYPCTAKPGLDSGIGKHIYPQLCISHRIHIFAKELALVEVEYARGSRVDFESTYRQVCNGVRIG